MAKFEQDDIILVRGFKIATSDHRGQIELPEAYWIVCGPERDGLYYCEPMPLFKRAILASMGMADMEIEEIVDGAQEWYDVPESYMEARLGRFDFHMD